MATSKTKTEKAEKPKKEKVVIPFANSSERDQYWDKAQIIARGWTWEAISEHLGKGDALYGECYLYKIERVLATEPNITRYCSQTQVIERGWTKSMITKLLGKHDAERKGIYKRTPSKLYRLERVEAAEQTEEFATLQQKAAKRSQQGIQIANRKREQLLERINNLPPIQVVIMPLNKLAKKALAAYNDWQEFKAYRNEKFSDYTKLDIKAVIQQAQTNENDRLFLERVQVNYIRHHLTTYDELIVEELFGKVGKNDVWLLFQERIYQAIIEAYPSLAEECNRQLNRKKAVHAYTNANTGKSGFDNKFSDPEDLYYHLLNHEKLQTAAEPENHTAETE